MIYWSGVILFLAVLAGLTLYLGAYTRRPGRTAGGFLACPMAIVLSLIFARLIHWFYRADSYRGIADVMTFSGGGYALSGAFAGCLATAWTLKAVKAVENLTYMLDCMSIGGAAAIGIGRLSGFFTPDNRGALLSPDTGLPWAYPTVNAVTGAEEYRFATFLIQAMAAGVILVVLTVLFYAVKKRRDGSLTCVFLLLYCASQAVLDSTRYDALHLRINGFIGLVQVLCVITLAVVIGFLSFRGIRSGGWKRWYLFLWLAALLGIGGGGYMEYYVQRHGDRLLFSYLTMGGCLTLTASMGFLLLYLTGENRSYRQAS